MIRIKIPLLAGFATALLGGCTTIGPEWEERGYRELASPVVKTFRDRQELEEFAAKTARTDKSRRERINRLNPQRGQRVVITGSRISAPPSITNNQVAGVDEGDFVKRIGDYLLILHDGRIFAVDFRRMEIVDWKDVYRRDDAGTAVGADWYDELLVSGSSIVVTAYDYEREATELTLIELDAASGRLTKGETFLLPSFDYYSSTNYATRLVDDRLVLYIPLPLETLIDEEAAVIERLGGSPADRLPIVEASEIYRPVFATPDPMLHVIMNCDLAAMRRAALDCRSQGIVGGHQVEWYIDGDATWLAVTQKRRDFSTGELCGQTGRAANENVGETVVWRLPHQGSSATILPVRGMPADQFGMQVTDRRFRMLSQWARDGCWDMRDDPPTDAALYDVPLHAFGRRYSAATEHMAIALPSVRGANLQNRFVGEWLVYGSRENVEGRPLEEDEEKRTDEAIVAIDLRRPKSPQTIEIGHQLRRLETLGDGIVLTGYRDTDGLNVTRLSFGDDARISGRAFVEGRFESESRSHSFNYRIDEPAGGLMALPTVGKGENDDGYPWRSEPSDISFLRFSPAGGVAPAFTIHGAEQDDKPRADEDGEGRWMRYPNGYECEISCTDWYGNARPIFIEGQVFALMGPNLVRAEAGEGEGRETGRLDITEAVISDQ